ncbi:MAG: PAS domain S-box protein [Chlorogloeopsis fritschii C42_A2020_084]|uniref:PAS domain S-box protein n=1 Tax=Chlorogloeopsis fritschii TaxID=1124 RepID=UPI0019F06C69|nr:PAS domain S-box protein [Chlorogloeopsis fritschii]MBF2006888.1 PAS domain S-box protein [Chlorogloeopsis fritschii C42_A2020_084]
MMYVNRLRQQSLNQIFSHPLLIGKFGSGFAILVGCLVMFGWWFNLEVLKNCFNLSKVTMKGNTALCFILLGISLWLSIKSREDSNTGIISKQVRKYSHSVLLARACAFTVFLIGTLTLIQYLFGWNFGIDQLLFLEEPNPRLTSQPGRMGLNTAVNFILLGKALELLGKPKTDRSIWYAQIFTLGAAVISLLALIGYAYQVQVLYGILPHVTSMALHTALTFTVLCVGILWAQPEQGLMQIVTSQTYGGLLARRLLLATFAVPLTTGWLILQGQRSKHYDTAFALALFAIILIVIFAILIWETASCVQRLANQRDRVKQALKTNSEKLRSFVEANVIGILYGDIYGGIEQANDKFLQMIGYTRKDLKAGKISWKEITPPEYLDLDAQKIAEAQINGACTPYEKEYIRRDGSRIPVLVGYTLVGNKREESVAFILDLSAHKQAQAALIQSEERFRLAVDHMPDVFAIYDAQRRFQFVNAAALQLFGKLKEDIIGRTDEEIFPAEVTEPYLATLIQAVETRTIQTTEARIISPDRGVLTTLIKYVPILDDQGKIYQILAFAEDITIRKQAEEVQKNQQKWLEDVLNLMPTPLLLIEPGTAQVTFANKAANEVAGGKFPMADSATDYHTLYYSTDAEGNPIPDAQAPGIRVARGERLDGVELDWHSPAGIRSLLIYADTLPAMHGHSATCVLTFQDITNLKQVEKALSLGYKRLHLLFSTASDLLSSQEPLTLIESLFRKLSEQIGLDVYFNYLVDENSQLMHLTSWCGIDEESAKKIECLRVGMGMCGTVAQQRLPIAVENVQQSTDSQSEFLRAIGATAYYGYPLMAQGRLLGTLCFISRTRLKFTQNEMGMMQAVCDQIAIAMERASLISSLQEQTEQLQQANRMKDEFLAILSHELRSPLNAILGWSQILRSRNLNDTQIHKALETIERNARAQAQLVDDLLDISRIIRGKLRLNVRTCDLINIIETALDTVNLAAQTKNIQIQTILDPTVAVVSGDAERLQQVVWNLLSNAIKFTPPGGRVEVRLSGANDGGVETRKDTNQCQLDSCQYPITSTQSPISDAQITVKDTGVGISPDFLPYVFDRFRQADSSITRSYGGLGLGLAIVRHLVELHGGTVHVESLGKEQGTTFIVNLPLIKTEPPKIHTQESIVNSPSFSLTPSLTPCLSGVRVLVVDDEADTRDFITTVLQESQAEVQAVSSVREALAAIECYKPDVLVSDIGMPEEDGYSLIRHLRSQPPEKGGKIPAAALTAYARAEDRRQAIQAGFQLHMPKPVDPSELVTVVASLVERNI